MSTREVKKIKIWKKKLNDCSNSEAMDFLNGFIIKNKSKISFDMPKEFQHLLVVIANNKNIDKNIINLIAHNPYINLSVPLYSHKNIDLQTLFYLRDRELKNLKQDNRFNFLNVIDTGIIRLYGKQNKLNELYVESLIEYDLYKHKTSIDKIISKIDENFNIEKSKSL